jgi:hypothetical protein
MRRQGGLHLAHGPGRLLFRPWRRVCRCGFGGWPCYVQTMLRRQAQGRAPVRQDPRPGGGMLDAAPLLTRGQANRSWPGGRR